MADTNGNKTGGRKAGIPNKVTIEQRQFITEILKGELGRLKEVMDKVYLEDPKGYWDNILKTMEFAIPKLARVEHTGDDGKPLELTLNLTPQEWSNLARKLITEANERNQ